MHALVVFFKKLAYLYWRTVLGLPLNLLYNF